VIDRRGAADAANAVDVCVVGSANLDLVATTDRLPAPGETVLGHSYAEHPGGKGLNQAVAAARSDAKTAFVCALGDDGAARLLRDVMRADDIETDHVSVIDGVATGRAMIGVSSGGENSIIVVPGANAFVEVVDLPRSTVVLAQLEVPLAAVVAAFTIARARGATTVLNPAPARVLEVELLGLCDVVVPNEHEIEMLGGVERLLAIGCRAVVVTRGRHGAAVHTRDGATDVSAFAVHTVDTTGAGDTFCGSLCAQLAAGDSLDDALRYASAAAALSTTRAGAVPSIPHRADVDRLLAGAVRKPRTADQQT
jgi:ribokinase